MAQEQLNQDIKWLESQLEAKKKELAGAGLEQKEEREIVKDIIKEAPQVPAPPPPKLSDDAALKASDELKEKEHAHVVDELVKLVFTKNLSSALKVARNLKNPHLLDEFHDTLADKYYEKLLESRKIKK